MIILMRICYSVMYITQFNDNTNNSFDNTNKTKYIINIAL